MLLNFTESFMMEDSLKHSRKAAVRNKSTHARHVYVHTTEDGGRSEGRWERTERDTEEMRQGVFLKALVTHHIAGSWQEKRKTFRGPPTT